MSGPPFLLQVSFTTVKWGATGVKEDQIFTLIILVDTIPVMQFEGFLAID